MHEHLSMMGRRQQRPGPRLREGDLARGAWPLSMWHLAPPGGRPRTRVMEAVGRRPTGLNYESHERRHSSDFGDVTSTNLQTPHIFIIYKKVRTFFSFSGAIWTVQGALYPRAGRRAWRRVARTVAPNVPPNSTLQCL